MARAVEQAQTSEQQLSSTQLAKTSDAVTSLADNSNQKDLLTSFDSLLDKVAIIVRVGDEVAKVWALLPLLLSYDPEKVAASSLCQLRLAGAVRRFEGQSNSPVNLCCCLKIGVLIDSQSATSSRPESLRSCQDNGRCILIRGSDG